MIKLIADIAPCPNSPGCVGHGEGISFDQKYFYYRVGKTIPKNKVSSLTWEGNYCGRQNGEREYIIVAWDTEQFVLLEHIYDNVRGRMNRYRDLGCQEAVALVQCEANKRKAEIDAMPIQITDEDLANYTPEVVYETRPNKMASI